MGPESPLEASLMELITNTWNY